MEKLNKLIQRCKSGVFIEINAHRNIVNSNKDGYETVEEYFNRKYSKNYIDAVILEAMDVGVYDKMKEQNTIVEIKTYFDNHVGYNHVFHYDLEMAIDEILSMLDVK